MSLRLTPASLRAAYDFLRSVAPFNRWKMPPSDEVIFKVFKSKDYFMGEYSMTESGDHVIRVSQDFVGHTATLLALMAHEMIHLYQAEKETESSEIEHNDEFYRLRDQVADIHGFDSKAL